MNRNNKQRRKNLIIVMVIIVAFSSLSVLTNRKQSTIEKAVGDSVELVEYYIIKKPINFFTGLISEYTEMRDVYEENQKLKSKLDQYANNQAQIDALNQEITDLKEQMGIDYLPSEYQIQVASVITRDNSTWDESITIDIGSDDNVEEGMAVVDSQGMIGVITSVSKATATVELLTTESLTNAIPVLINNGDQVLYGLLESYDSDKGCFEVTMLSTFDSLNDDSEVYTSGLGGDDKAPKDIYIGKTTSTSTEEDGTTTIVYVKPAGDFDDLAYVSVVEELGNGE